MQNNILTIILLLAVGIFMSNLLVLYSFWKIKNKSSEYSGKFDDRYLDLNLKFQLLLTTLIMASTLLAVFGWNVKSQITNDLKTEVIKDVTLDIKKLQSKLDSLEILLNKTNNIQKDQFKEISKLNIESVKVKNNFNELNNVVNNKLANLKTLLNIYIIPDIEFKYNWDQIEDKPIRFYFNKLKPINAPKLPKFKKTPIVNVQAQNFIFSVFQTTKEYVEVVPFGTSGKETKITLWIVER